MVKIKGKRREEEEKQIEIDNRCEMGEREAKKKRT